MLETIIADIAHRLPELIVSLGETFLMVGIALAAAGENIVVLSPPDSTWALPGPWQLSHVTPLPPCSNASLA